MKVNLVQPVEVSDLQRQQLASVLDGKLTKRMATRNEWKDFLWEEGASWEIVLTDRLMELTGDDDGEDEDLENLL